MKDLGDLGRFKMEAVPNLHSLCRKLHEFLVALQVWRRRQGLGYAVDVHLYRVALRHRLHRFSRENGIQIRLAVVRRHEEPEPEEPHAFDREVEHPLEHALLDVGLPGDGTEYRIGLHACGLRLVYPPVAHDWRGSLGEKQNVWRRRAQLFVRRPSRTAEHSQQWIHGAGGSCGSFRGSRGAVEPLRHRARPLVLRLTNAVVSSRALCRFSTKSSPSRTVRPGGSRARDWGGGPPGARVTHRTQRPLWCGGLRRAVVPCKGALCTLNLVCRETRTVEARGACLSRSR
mmetsp:Transcript_73050/g.152557  ORF Transcript_73050/g.152557 Transcript_73050/m.152557 type:complete len:287 (+) Transcript_73050:873-1733(+)